MEGGAALSPTSVLDPKSWAEKTYHGFPLQSRLSRAAAATSAAAGAWLGPCFQATKNDI